jgi:hypothetical protein
MAYTIWHKPYRSDTWQFSGLQIDSEKLAEQTFALYRLAPGEVIQLRDPEGFVLNERRDMSRPPQAPEV